MPSRKRNKGRDRKAKKAEQKAALEVARIESLRAVIRSKWKRWARGVDINGQSIECNHGVDLVIPDEDSHPVASFADAFFQSWATNSVHVGQYLRDTFTDFREVWDNESYREMAANIFIAVGTNYLLDGRALDGPYVLAHAIVFLENYDGIDIISTLNSRVVATKLRDLYSGGSSSERDLSKFFRKRTACSCLKKIHLEARKALPKLGVCYHCHKVNERASLMVCSRCRIVQYCSRECQVANWSRHKCRCDQYGNAHEQHTKNCDDKTTWTKENLRTAESP